jgi:hypothetical protein
MPGGIGGIGGMGGMAPAIVLGGAGGRIPRAAAAATVPDELELVNPVDDAETTVIKFRFNITMYRSI